MSTWSNGMDICWDSFETSADIEFPDVYMVDRNEYMLGFICKKQQHVNVNDYIVRLV